MYFFVLFNTGTFILYSADLFLSTLFSKFLKLFYFSFVDFFSREVLIYISTFCCKLSTLFRNFFKFFLFSFLCLLFCFWAKEKLVTSLFFFLMFNHITSLYILHIHLLISSPLINQRLIYINIFSLSCQQIF